MESQEFEDREAIPRAENLLLSLEELLAAGLHIGTRIKTVDMEKYIFRVRPDGLFILNIGETNEKIRVAAKFMRGSEPGRVLAVSSRLYGKTPIDRFAELTKGHADSRPDSCPASYPTLYSQNTLNTSRTSYGPEGGLASHQEATAVGIPVIALCDTDNVFSGVDLVIPVNNKGRRALAVVYCC